MIKASRLFLVPSIAMFFLLIPFIGIFLTLITLCIWYNKNSREIHRYFRGENYELNEVDKDYDSLLK